MQQQIIIAAWAITYANDREAARQARREFNVSIAAVDCGEVEKTTAGNGKDAENQTSWKASH